MRTNGSTGSVVPLLIGAGLVLVLGVGTAGGALATAAARVSGRRVPRTLHPIAWWIWALGLAVAASRTTNPLLLAARARGARLRRRQPAHRRAVGARVQVLPRARAGRDRDPGRVPDRVRRRASTPGDHVLFRLPHVPPPGWYAGRRSSAARCRSRRRCRPRLDGLRLGTLSVASAPPTRSPTRSARCGSCPARCTSSASRSWSSITVAPQLVESVQRVAPGARAARPDTSTGLRALRSIAMPVLEDALERSFHARRGDGLARLRPHRAAARRAVAGITAALLLAGLLGLCVGAYGLLDAYRAALLGLPALAGRRALSCAGLAARRPAGDAHAATGPTRGRCRSGSSPRCGVARRGARHREPALRTPPRSTRRSSRCAWPTLPLVPTIAILIGAIPAASSRRPAAGRRARRRPEPSSSTRARRDGPARAVASVPA